MDNENSMEVKAPNKYVTRTFHVVTGTMLVVDYEKETFERIPVTFVDWEGEFPPGTNIDDERDIKIRMPVEQFVKTGEYVVKDDES